MHQFFYYFFKVWCMGRTLIKFKIRKFIKSGKQWSSSWLYISFCLTTVYLSAFFLYRSSNLQTKFFVLQHNSSWKRLKKNSYFYQYNNSNLRVLCIVFERKTFYWTCSLKKKSTIPRGIKLINIKYPLKTLKKKKAF